MAINRNFYYRKLLIGLLSFCVLPALIVFSLTFHFSARNLIEKYALHEIERMNRIMLSNNRIFAEMTETFLDIPTSLDFAFFTDHTFSDDITKFYKFSDLITTRLFNSHFLHSVTLYSQPFGYSWTMDRGEDTFSRDISTLFAYDNTEYYRRFLLRTIPATGESLISYIYPSFRSGVQGEMLLIVNVAVEKLREETDELSDLFDKKVFLVIDKTSLMLDSGHDYNDAFDVIDFVNHRQQANWIIERKGLVRSIVTKVHGDPNKAIYYSTVDVGQYSADFRSFFYFALLLLVVFLFFSVFLAVHYTRHLYTPVANLLQRLSPESRVDQNINEFQLILNKYTRILESNEDLKTMLSANELVMRDRFLENLIKSHYDSEDGVASGLRRFKIVIDDTCCVINCYVEGRQELIDRSWSGWLQIKSQLQNIAIDVLNQYESLNALTCEISGEEVIILVSYSSKLLSLEHFHALLEEFLSGVISACGSEIDEVVHLGVGGITEDILELEQSYFQSVSALRLGLLPGEQRVHYYQPGMKNIRSIKSMKTFLNRFILLANNDGSGVEELVGKMVEDAVDGNLTPWASYSHYIRIISQVTEYIQTHLGVGPEEYLDKNPHLQISQCKTQGEIQVTLISFLSASLAVIKKNYGVISPSGRKTQQAIDYILEHYGDISLNLTKVADIVGVNPSYLSRIFSQEQGQAFQHFLSDVRLNEARRLITETEIPIYKISVKAGFGSVLSFNRTFKKKEGCTPREYRSNHS